ncbi:hypothetical protein, partial [Ruminococcus sp.]|uniref:hypothetical protein n=1 Tax=Ruminococcus sp. TaxID=41978 RepID=UPI003F81432E
MKLRKILLKRFLITAGVSILLTAVFSTAAFWFIFSSSEKATIKNYAAMVTSLYNKDSSYEQLHDLSSSKIRITLLDSSGNVLLESEDGVDVTKMGNHSNRPEFINAMKNGYGDDSRKSETIGRVTYYYAEKTANGNVLRVSETIENGYSLFMHLVPILLGVIILVFILCYILSKRSTKKIIAPIENLESNADGTQYEELSSISRTISSQQKQISKQVTRLQLEKDRIDTLIQNMSEGFIMLDMDKNMLMCNHSASKYLGTDSEGTVGESLISFSRNEVLCECVDKAFDGERSSNEGSINGRVLQIIASPVYSNS